MSMMSAENTFSFGRANHDSERIKQNSYGQEQANTHSMTVKYTFLQTKY